MTYTVRTELPVSGINLLLCSHRLRMFVSVILLFMSFPLQLFAPLCLMFCPTEPQLLMLNIMWQLQMCLMSKLCNTLRLSPLCLPSGSCFDFSSTQRFHLFNCSQSSVSVCFRLAVAAPSHSKGSEGGMGVVVNVCGAMLHHVLLLPALQCHVIDCT